jgi:hypothetical protein
MFLGMWAVAPSNWNHIFSCLRKFCTLRIRNLSLTQVQMNSIIVNSLLMLTFKKLASGDRSRYHHTGQTVGTVQFCTGVHADIQLSSINSSVSLMAMWK